MNQLQAINQAMKKLSISASSKEIFEEANRIISEHKNFMLKQKEWSSISELHSTEIKAPQSNYTVIRKLKQSNIVEFLGEEFWMNLSLRDKVLAKDIYARIRVKFEE